MGVIQWIFVKDKGVKFAVLGEIKVNGKPAVGVTAFEGGAQMTWVIYFDKARMV